ncbi:MAG: DUF721 domain-containing protein [Bacteroidota bacterium]
MSFNEHKRNADEKPLGELIDRLMRAYGLDDKMKELDVINAWSELMGPAVAARTKSIRIHQKTLFLGMDSSVMREELQYGKQIIILRLNEYAGFEIINDIYFA